jgi:hypothetical protein
MSGVLGCCLLWLLDKCVVCWAVFVHWFWLWRTLSGVLGCFCWLILTMTYSVWCTGLFLYTNSDYEVLCLVYWAVFVDWFWLWRTPFGVLGCFCTLILTMTYSVWCTVLFLLTDSDYDVLRLVCWVVFVHWFWLWRTPDIELRIQGEVTHYWTAMTNTDRCTSHLRYTVYPGFFREKTPGYTVYPVIRVWANPWRTFEIDHCSLYSRFHKWKTFQIYYEIHSLIYNMYKKYESTFQLYNKTDIDCPYKLQAARHRHITCVPNSAWVAGDPPVLLWPR